MTPTTFTPGTKVRRTDNGRTGTVDYTAVETDSLAEYPDMVPVAWDGDDAWLTAAHVLEVDAPLPAANSPQEPEKAANDGGTNERSTTMSTTTLERRPIDGETTERMRNALKRAGVSVQMLADELDVSSSYIQRRRTGECSWPVTFVLYVANRTGVSVRELIDDSGAEISEAERDTQARDDAYTVGFLDAGRGIASRARLSAHPDDYQRGFDERIRRNAKR